MKISIKLVMGALALASVFLGCTKISVFNGRGASTVTVTGVAMLGPIDGATVSFFDFDHGVKGSLLATTKSVSGAFTASLPTGIRHYLVEVAGGKYKSEATGVIMTNGVLAGSYTIADKTAVATPIGVTPLTQIALNHYYSHPDTDPAQSNATVAKVFDIPDVTISPLSDSEGALKSLAIIAGIANAAAAASMQQDEYIKGIAIASDGTLPALGAIAAGTIRAITANMNILPPNHFGVLSPTAAAAIRPFALPVITPPGGGAALTMVQCLTPAIVAMLPPGEFKVVPIANLTKTTAPNGGLLVFSGRDKLHTSEDAEGIAGTPPDKIKYLATCTPPPLVPGPQYDPSIPLHCAAPIPSPTVSQDPAHAVPAPGNGKLAVGCIAPGTPCPPLPQSLCDQATLAAGGALPGVCALAGFTNNAKYSNTCAYWIGGVSLGLCPNGEAKNLFIWGGCDDPCGQMHQCGAGCFARGTRVKIGDGTEKLAELIGKADTLWNPMRRRAFGIKRVTVSPERRNYFELVVGEKTLTVTGIHPILTPKGMVKAETLKADALVLDAAGKPVRLTAVRRVPPEQAATVFNFELDTPSVDPIDHVIEANGLASGDLSVQTSLGTGIAVP